MTNVVRQGRVSWHQSGHMLEIAIAQPEVWKFEFACSRILAFPFDVGLGLGDPIVVDLDQHGADKSD